MSVQFEKSHQASLSPELQKFQQQFFEVLDNYIRTIEGDGIYDVMISKRATDDENDFRYRNPKFTRRLVVICKEATGLVEQFALAEQMMLFWGERVQKLQETIRKIGGGR